MALAEDWKLKLTVLYVCAAAVGNAGCAVVI
jgi:hypothetical protein